MIKVLHIVPALDGGGIENLLLSYYMHMDRNKFKFDFIVYGDEKGALESTFEELGSTIYHIPPRHEALFLSLKKMKEIIFSNEYDIVHAHQNLMSFIPLTIAKKRGIKIRIAHSHSNNSRADLINKIFNAFFSFLVKKSANYYYACGLEAGKFVFGKKNVECGKVTIIKNAIDLSKFKFDKEWRDNTRKQLGVENKFVVAQIGRFGHEKNHILTLDAFKEIVKIKNNVVLFFIGDGELKESIEKKVIETHLGKYVKFLGNCNNVYQLLSAIDVLLLPSLHEGLPLTPIEAQATGLKCIVSSKVTKEIKITELVEFLDIDDPIIWAKKVLENSSNNNRVSKQKEVAQAGYDIEYAAKCLQNKYFQMIFDNDIEGEMELYE